jgi:glutathione reductase (NADPH)
MHLGVAGEEHLITSTDFLELAQLPAKIVLLGGGFIAAEFAHIAARAGAQVTVLEQADRLLTPFDPDLVGWLMDKFREVGIDVRLNTRVTAIERNSGDFSVRAASGGREQVFTADLVVHAAGRVPDLEPLSLAAAGVETDKGRLRLNEFLQSMSNPAIYAAGDAAMSGPPLTPVASHDAKVAAANMLKGNHVKPNYFGVPSVAFTIPPIASVGLSEKQARERGLKFRVQTQRASGWYTARRVAETIYGFKVLVEDETAHILGAHLVGPHVDEVINIFALAMRKGLTAEDLKTTIFAYPTGASDIGYMV